MKNVLLIFILITGINSDKDSTIAEIGKQVPDYTFNNVLNSPQRKISLRSLKGKIVILEFWATWCGPCIPAMKNLDILQKEFKDALEVITISTESEERLERFIKSSNTSLRIASDTSHTLNFRYNVIPHSIIIDREGIVRAITSPGNINAGVLNNLISNNEISLNVKDDFYSDPAVKVGTIKSIVNSNYRIELKSYDPAKRGGAHVFKDSDGNINGIEIWNSPIPRLYQYLFEIASPGRMIFKDGLSYATDFPYEKGHQFNFTIEVSNDHTGDWKKLGIDFLNENFDFNGRKAIDTLDCFVLKNRDSEIKESDSNEVSVMITGSILKAKKIKISRLTAYLENFNSLPVVDATNLKGEYDIDLNWLETDPKTLSDELGKYGLVLEKSEKKLPVEVMEIYRKR
jgi:peroxiredoxin